MEKIDNKLNLEKETAQGVAPEEFKKVELEEVKKVVTPALTDGQLDNIAKSMKEVFAAMEKVRIRIPVDKMNKDDLIVPVCVNGYIYQIERGKYVEVPQTIADILENAGYLG